MYKVVNYQVKFENGISPSMPSETGVKQGCVMSPLLIKIYSETCLLRPPKGLCQVVLIEQVVFIARLSNLTLTFDFFFMINIFILFYYYKKPI